jgi:hypothetical protein
MLSSDLDREITAVRAGMQELHELNGRGAFFEPGRRQRTTNNFIQD